MKLFGKEKDVFASVFLIADVIQYASEAELVHRKGALTDEKVPNGERMVLRKLNTSLLKQQVLVHSASRAVDLLPRRPDHAYVASRIQTKVSLSQSLFGTI